MVARDFSSWVPIEIDPQVHGRTVTPSAIVSAAGRTKAMQANQVEIPRLVDADIGGGSALTEDTNDGSTTPLWGYQFNGKHSLDEAVTEDSLPDELASTGAAWMTSFNKAYDSASIGVVGARSATIADGRPYNSILQTVTTADAEVGYTANDNYDITTGIDGGALTYDEISQTLGLVERGEFWNEEMGAWLMHPHLKQLVRDVENPSGTKVFVESTSGAPGGGVRPVYHLFGYPVFFSYGAIRSTKYVGFVGGGVAATNPLLVCVNRAHLVRGDRVAPQSRFIPASMNPTALEHIVQHRARKGFALAIPQAAAVLEVDITLA